MINEHLNELDEELANQMQLVTSKKANAESVKKYQDFIWDEQTSIVAISPFSNKSREMDTWRP